MPSAPANQNTQRGCLRYLLAICMFVLAISPCPAQKGSVNDDSMQDAQRELLKNRALLESFGRVTQKMQTAVKLPEPRTESRLLPLLPSETLFFAAIPNYGAAAQQALEIFQQELKSDAALREWWAKRDVAKNGPPILEGLEKLCRLHQYLGGEIMLTGSLQGNEPEFLAVAEVRKPGLDKFLAEVIESYGGFKQVGARVIAPQELPALRQMENRKDLLVVVRPDFVFASEDPEVLRSFNAGLTASDKRFLSTPFGTRVAREYRDGLTLLVAANLEAAINKIPPPRQNPDFQQSGFAEAKYLVWDHKRIEGKDVSQSELSFSVPRHGIAAWLAKPGPLNSLEFVSPEALFDVSLKLSSPAQIFDEILAMSKPGPGSPLATVSQAEKALGLSVREDLLGTLDGEISLELDDLRPQRATWRAVLGVKDVPHLQKTLRALLAATQTKVDQAEEDGISYNTLRLPSSPAFSEISYTFLDNFLVIGSGRDIIKQSAKLHRSGDSLLKSEKFRAATPPGHTADASAVWYQNPKAMALFQMQRFAPDLAGSLTSALNDAPPAVAFAYGEESSIKSASTNSLLDIGAILVVAAVAIPNLIKSKVAANEASAVGSLRTITTAQIAYATTYPKRGFSPNLARLGPVPSGGSTYASPLHADFLDASLGGASCTGDAWCTKSGYQFRISATCSEGNCTHFVAVAKPESPSTGTRSFCVTDNGVIHFQLGGQSPNRLTIAECRKWQAIQ